MKVHELNQPSTKNPKRLGRGIAAGGGKTAGRGTKGQGARSGGNRRPGFEGGQNPLMHRIPKRRGFKSLNPKAQVIHTDQLNQLNGKVGVDELKQAGLIQDSRLPVKLLKRGELSKKLSLRGVEASQAATEAVKQAGGSLTATTSTSGS